MDEEKFKYFIKKYGKEPLTRPWPKEIFEELIHKDYSQEISKVLLKLDISDSFFDMLLEVIINYDYNYENLIRDLVLKYLDNEQRLKSVFRVIFILRRGNLGDLIEKIFDRYYYDSYLKSKDKFHYKVKDTLFISQVIITLGEYGQVNCYDKLKEIEKTQKINEPILSQWAEFSLKKLEKLKNEN